jgi:hypothetical protein
MSWTKLTDLLELFLRFPVQTLVLLGDDETAPRRKAGTHGDVKGESGW